MEVITNPAMLFLDEPTSGLDTYTAFTVVKALQNLAHRQGRTIVSTIHQPSSETFYLFDDLMLLSDGKIVYYGPVENSIDYFARLGYPCPKYTNPADFFFMNILSDIDGTSNGDSISTSEESDEVLFKDRDMPKARTGVLAGASAGAVAGVSAGVVAGAARGSAASRRQTRPISWLPMGIQEKASDRMRNLLEYWPQSEECEQMNQYIKQDSNGTVSPLSYKGHASYATQFCFLAKRASKNAIRNKMIVQVRLVQSIAIGVILGLVYLDQSQYTVQEQIRNKSGVLFFIVVNQYFSSANQVLAIFYQEKSVFLREYYAGYYRLSAYFWTKILMEVCWVCVSVLTVGRSRTASSSLTCWSSSATT